LPPSREKLRQLVLALQHPGGHEPARRIFASLSELGELRQIKELERQSAISGRSGERRHALNPEHVLQEASASHESGTSNGSALVTVLVEQSDESSLGVGQRWYLLAREQSRISVSQLPRTRVRDLAQDAFLFEMQGMQVLLQPGSQRQHLRGTFKADQADPFFPSLASPELISHPVPRRREVRANLSRVQQAYLMYRRLVDEPPAVALACPPVFPGMACQRDSSSSNGSPHTAHQSNVARASFRTSLIEPKSALTLSLATVEITG
jgi:hypothetical protein